MELLSVRPFIAFINDGRGMRVVVSVALRLLALALAAGTLLGAITTVRGFSALPPAAVIGGVLFLVFFVGAAYYAVQVLWIRADEAGGVGLTRMRATQLSAHALRALGETYAVFVALTAIGGTVFIWFTASSLHRNFGELQPLLPETLDRSFFGGLKFLVAGFLRAALTLVVAHLVAELLERVARRDAA